MDRKNILSGKENKPLVIPATPNLKRLGYGTGVGVFHVDRSPKNGLMSSPWALKKLMRGKNNTIMGQRLRIEADILRKLNHPNIVGFRAFLQTSDGLDCLAMEKCQASLYDLIESRECDSFSPDEIQKVAQNIGMALDYIHNEIYLLHGDIKSANILIKENFDEIKLCDFGVSLPLNTEGHLKRETAGKHATYIGTQLWSAPEVCHERTDKLIITDKADVFSFGLTLWEMMSLTSPHMIDLMDETDDSFDEEAYDEKLSALIGTRPPIPEHIASDQSYEKMVDLFVRCTELDYKTRVSAKAILQFLADC